MAEGENEFTPNAVITHRYDEPEVLRAILVSTLSFRGEDIKMKVSPDSKHTCRVLTTFEMATAPS